MRYGHFDNENREYVIERPDVPVSWTNYLGVENLCTVLSHNAGGYSFYKTRRAPAHHALPPQRRAARPARPLRLPARRRYRRILVDLLAARGQRPGAARSTNAATAFRIRSSPAITGTCTPSRPSSSRSATTWSCGTCASATTAPRRGATQRLLVRGVLLPPHRDRQPEPADEPVRQRDRAARTASSSTISSTSLDLSLLRRQLPAR